MEPEEMLLYATKFTFPTEVVGFTQVTVEQFHDYWVIRVGEARWDKKKEVFCYFYPEDDMSDTMFDMEEAVELASSKDLYKEHLMKVRGIKS